MLRMEMLKSTKYLCLCTAPEHPKFAALLRGECNTWSQPVGILNEFQTKEVTRCTFLSKGTLLIFLFYSLFLYESYYPQLELFCKNSNPYFCQKLNLFFWTQKPAWVRWNFKAPKKHAKCKGCLPAVPQHNASWNSQGDQ